MVTFKQLTAAQLRVTKTARKFGSVQRVYLQRKNASKTGAVSKALMRKFRNASGAYDDASRKYRKLYDQSVNQEKAKKKKFTDFYNRMGAGR